MSVRDYEAMSVGARSEYIVSFLEKMTYGIGQQSPELAARIRDYYIRTPPDRPFSDGIAEIGSELLVLDRLAEGG